jgi:hypothetical protein
MDYVARLSRTVEEKTWLYSRMHIVLTGVNRKSTFGLECVVSRKND